ncbi:MAG TPA: glucuronate isomerase [Clostridiales bacterium]|nr:glucuronate isomerase [Clostridiales bacterium]
MFGGNFLLKGRTAEALYHNVAKCAPIYDYHCHLSAKDIYEDLVFQDISALWLKYDHYKWRAMRYAGVPEELITGKGSSLEKFTAWAKTCERLIGSPLYHWANMELQTYFGVESILKERNAEEIYHFCNARIKKEALSPVKMIQSSKVKLICTTDDPLDDLAFHKLLRTERSLDFMVRPTFRPDKALNIGKEEFLDYVGTLGTVTGQSIHSYSDFMKGLRDRIEYFGTNGCLLSDHSLESLSYSPTSEEEVSDIFLRRMKGHKLTKEETERFRQHTLTLLALEYHRAGWVMQLHIGAYRNTNGERFKALGADAGYDVMNDFNILEPLAQLLDGMEGQKGLPKTILYTLNSKDNLVLSALPHCFGEDEAAGKLQFGPAWWFCDNKEEILRHLTAIANQGMLADFVGMLTDSRSFLSYVRHDYFRRILCSYIGELVDNGEFDADEDILAGIVEGICYKNIIKYLGDSVK